MTMERDLSSGTLENVPLSEDNNQVASHMHTIPTMGGTAIANPMAPAFPHSNPVSNSQQSINSSPAQLSKDISAGMGMINRPNSLPQANSIPSHSYSAPNSLTSPATPVSMAAPIRDDSAAIIRPANSKMDSLKTWSISTYKCTKQLISEKLGKSTKTVDSELEAQIETLRDTQRKYSQILRLSRSLSSHFYHVVQTQHQLGDTFAELAQKSPELQEEFIYNAETQRTLTKNGETLLGALNFFVNSVNTLCNKTMEDTLLTVKQYEQARIEYDAYRSDLETLNQQPRAEVSSIRLDEAQRQFHVQKANYDRLRSDVAIKLKFLEENKVKVMHKQLLLFHNAVSAYFSGNQASLEATLKQFNVKLQSPNTSPPSWLEQ
ncbi:Arfaptin-2 [Armadillidium vulgare]|nr:Arfaptin-2 [Armadillidium vulgare]